MSLLPCDGNLVALGVVKGRFWNLGALRKHMLDCQPCASVYRAMAAAMGARGMGAQGGRAGRGAAKRRGSSEHYRRLAKLSWSAPK